MIEMDQMFPDTLRASHSPLYLRMIPSWNHEGTSGGKMV